MKKLKKLIVFVTTLFAVTVLAIITAVILLLHAVDVHTIEKSCQPLTNQCTTTTIR